MFILTLNLIPQFHYNIIYIINLKSKKKQIKPNNIILYTKIKNYFNQLIIHKSIKIKLTFNKKKNLHLFHIYTNIFIHQYYIKHF